MTASASSTVESPSDALPPYRLTNGDHSQEIRHRLSRAVGQASTLVTIRCNGRDAGRRPTLSGNRVPVGLATGWAILKCGLQRVLMPA
jgi:hypothetical protein